MHISEMSPQQGQHTSRNIENSNQDSKFPVPVVSFYWLIGHILQRIYSAALPFTLNPMEPIKYCLWECRCRHLVLEDWYQGILISSISTVMLSSLSSYGGASSQRKALLPSWTSNPLPRLGTLCSGSGAMEGSSTARFQQNPDTSRAPWLGQVMGSAIEGRAQHSA